MRTAAEIERRLKSLESIHAMIKLPEYLQAVLWGVMATLRWMVGWRWPPDLTKAAIERAKKSKT